MTASFTQPGDGTMLLDRAGREISYRRIKVEVISGVDQGKTFVAEGGEISIGTSDGSDLQLTDPAVSRHHCAVAVVARGYQLADLGSTNGTTVAGIGVERALVRPGAIVEIGQTRLRFDVGDDRVREPLAVEERWGRALGRSSAMRRIFAILPRLAGGDTSLLLEGETGTGKSLLAEVIHDASNRRTRPFVVVDCGAIPPTLIESELFGHEKGAFTGAAAARRGVFEAAEGGTVFLDEIGELPLEMQPKLLRALEDRVVRRVGGNDTVKLDVRVIAATNRDLRQEVNRGRFRTDLLYRLNTVRLRVPPLRERRDDVGVLAAHFWTQFANDPHAAPPAELLTDWLRRDWPGNVRELRSAVERAVLLDDPLIWAEISTTIEVPASAEVERAFEFDEAASFRVAKERAVGAWERGYVRELVRRHDGNLSRAARAARMDRNHLRELLRRHGVSASDD
ncbi:MAG: sigma 54-interacting transcriptional regulator [Myxococcales bacterium]|nr:sigma 54-interacting transcriptional regulator [Myxococcales bacterium]